MNIDHLIEKAGTLIEALPYIQRFNKKTVIIKYGGHAMASEELKQSVIEDITLLKFIGLNPIIVHGGGPDISQALKERQIESKFVEGLRVTDDDTMQVAQEVLVGKTNKEIVSLVGQNGGKAVGICGIDGRVIECEKHYVEKDGEKIDIGHVGDIINVNTNLLRLLIEDEYIPVIAPIGTDKDGNSYNINADTVASAIAKAMKAEKLILLTDIDGVLDKDGKVLYIINCSEVDALIENGTISGGMIPKVLGCTDAIFAGVSTVHIIDGRVPHSILLEVFTDTGIGTMITR